MAFVFLTLLLSAASIVLSQQTPITAPPGTPSGPGSAPTACNGDAHDAMATFNMIPMEFFLAKDSKDDCETPQTLVHHGTMSEMACRMAPPKYRGELCICSKKPQEMLDAYKSLGIELKPSSSGFVNECGACHDPCAPKFTPAETNATVLVTGMRILSKHPPMGFFPAAGTGDDDCDDTPDTILTGPRDLGCLTVNQPEPCLCVKKPAEYVDAMKGLGVDVHVSKASGYTNVCGRCVFPCAQPVFNANHGGNANANTNVGEQESV